MIDVVHWFLDLDHPTSASSAGGLFFSQDGRETPDVIHTLWTYPEKLVVTWEGNQHNGADGAGIVFYGSNGTLYIDRQLYEWTPREGEKVIHHDGDLPRGHFNVRPDQDAAHLKDWIDAVRDRKPPRCPIEIGVNAAGASHLGNDAYRRGSSSPGRTPDSRLAISTLSRRERVPGGRVRGTGSEMTPPIHPGGGTAPC